MTPDRPAPTRLDFARRLHGLAERDDLPRPEVRVVPLRTGAEGVQVSWPRGPRRVVATVLHHGCFVACYEGFATIHRADLSRHGVESLRRALAWLVGEAGRPEGRR
jgi:hypothetical protein